MNLKTLTLISGIALGLIAVPAADAQRSRDGRTGGRAPSAGMQPAMADASRSQLAARSGGQFRGEQSHRWRNRGDGDWRNRDRGDRWGNHNHWRHRHHYPRYYPRYYGGFYGSPYGYGYPFGGYGYGYPYFGSSAALYYYGYRPQPRYVSTGSVRGGSVTAEVQQQLARAGYYRGSIDGVMGNGTRSAIRAYERANRLRVDGLIDQELLSSMGIG